MLRVTTETAAWSAAKWLLGSSPTASEDAFVTQDAERVFGMNSYKLGLASAVALVGPYVASAIAQKEALLAGDLSFYDYYKRTAQVHADFKNGVADINALSDDALKALESGDFTQVFDTTLTKQKWRDNILISLDWALERIALHKVGFFVQAVDAGEMSGSDAVSDFMAASRVVVLFDLAARNGYLAQLRDGDGSVGVWYVWVIGAVALIAVLAILAFTYDSIRTSASRSDICERMLRQRPNDPDLRSRCLGDIPSSPLNDFARKAGDATQLLAVGLAAAAVSYIALPMILSYLDSGKQPVRSE